MIIPDALAFIGFVKKVLGAGEQIIMPWSEGIFIMVDNVADTYKKAVEADAISIMDSCYNFMVLLVALKMYLAMIGGHRKK